MVASSPELVPVGLQALSLYECICIVNSTAGVTCIGGARVASAMDDAVRPSKERFSRVLDDSYNQWLSYLNNANTTPQLPSYCADLKCILRRTPAFLGYDLLSGNVKLPFTCVEKESINGQYGLLASGSSVWAVSRGDCRLESNIMPLDILLGVPNPLMVHISDSALLTKWTALIASQNMMEAII